MLTMLEMSGQFANLELCLSGFGRLVYLQKTSANCKGVTHAMLFDVLSVNTTF
jgi:hypothetical protein